MTRSLLRVALMVLGLNVGRAGSACAQLKVPLDSVEKITLVSSAPWWNGSAYYRYEIVPQDGKWKVYRLEIHTDGIGQARVNDTTRRYAKELSKKEISTFLKLLAKQDTGINPALFNIDRKRVLGKFDTMLPYASPQQRAIIAKRVRSKKFIDSATVRAMRHANFDDRSGYYILIKTRSGKVHEVTAIANYEVYGHLPWTIGNLKSYDTRISAFFDGLVKNKANEFAVNRFYGDLVFWSYMDGLKTTLAIDELKRNFLEAYQSLTAVFVPVAMGDNNSLYGLDPRRPIDSLYYSGSFLAKGMPKYIKLGFSFKPVDTATISAKKRYADTVVHLFNNITIFDHLKDRSGVEIVISKIYTDRYSVPVFNIIAKYFPDLEKYGPGHINLIYIKGTDDISSVWILLPDNSLILCKYLYKGKLPKREAAYFMGFDDAIIQRHYGKSGKVWIHLSPTGVLIKDYDEVPELDL